MAKITFPIISDAKGLHAHGDSLIRRMGTVVRRRRARSPRRYRFEPSLIQWIRSSKRYDVNTIARHISDRWHTLSLQQVSDWISYSNHFTAFKSGYQAYFANNMRLRRPHHPSLNWIDNISCPPLVVPSPTGVCVQFITILGSFCVTWSGPACVNQFIQAFEWVQPGRSRQTAQRFKYVTTVNSLEDSLSIPVTFLSSGAVLLPAIRTVNLRGEISPCTFPGSFLKPAYQSGIYGCVYYAYAFYGPGS